MRAVRKDRSEISKQLFAPWLAFPINQSGPIERRAEATASASFRNPRFSIRKVQRKGPCWSCQKCQKSKRFIFSQGEAWLQGPAGPRGVRRHGTAGTTRRKGKPGRPVLLGRPANAGLRIFDAADESFACDANEV